MCCPRFATCQRPGPTTAVVWFRRDLRLADNRALVAALSKCDRVVPLFVWDPVLMNASGPNRLGFLAGCVDMLNRSLDGQLVVRSGDPVRAVAQAAAEANATRVYVSGDYGPYGSTRDRRAAATWDGEVEVVAVDSPYAVAPGTLRTKTGTGFQVFSAFARAWREHGWSPPASSTFAGKNQPSWVAGRWPNYGPCNCVLITAGGRSGRPPAARNVPAGGRRPL